jgi:hypothetical protein
MLLAAPILRTVCAMQCRLCSTAGSGVWWGSRAGGAQGLLTRSLYVRYTFTIEKDISVVYNVKEINWLALSGYFGAKVLE